MSNEKQKLNSDQDQKLSKTVEDKNFNDILDIVPNYLSHIIYFQSKDVFVVDTNRISLKKLQLFLKKQQIHHMLKHMVKSIIDDEQDNQFELEFIPCKVIPSIMQSRKWSYLLKIRNLKPKQQIPWIYQLVQKPHEIIHIKFKDLKKIILYDLDLTNIEVIQFLNAPNLQYLSIQQNRIHNIDCLVKAQLPQLYTFYFGNNLINRLDKLSRFRSKFMYQGFFSDNQQYYQAYNSLFKIESPINKIYKWIKTNHIKNIQIKLRLCLIKKSSSILDFYQQQMIDRNICSRL